MVCAAHGGLSHVKIAASCCSCMTYNHSNHRAGFLGDLRASSHENFCMFWNEATATAF